MSYRRYVEAFEKYVSNRAEPDELFTATNLVTVADESARLMITLFADGTSAIVPGGYSIPASKYYGLCRRFGSETLLHLH